MMRFDIITLFPEMFAALDCGIPGQAKKRNLCDWHCWNPRDYTTDKHRTVDDRPYGGGPGMVMMAEPVMAAITAAQTAAPTPGKVIHLSPQGKPLTQDALMQLRQCPRLLLLCGRYEGIDERVVDTVVDEEWSLGDFILSGGELAALALMDGVIRLLPEALGNTESNQQDSFSAGLLDHPHYTRPEECSGLKVPSVLLSGDHQAIARWRAQQALGRTWQRRPDLLAKMTLTAEQEALLREFTQQCAHQGETGDKHE